MSKLTLTDPKSHFFGQLSKSELDAKGSGDIAYLSLDGFKGGVIRLSHDHDEVANTEALAMDLAAGTHLFLHEQCPAQESLPEGKGSPLFLDLDFSFEDPTQEPTKAFEEAVLSIIDKAVRLFYPVNCPDRVFTMLVFDLSRWIREEQNPALVPEVVTGTPEQLDEDAEEAAEEKQETTTTPTLAGSPIISGSPASKTDNSSNPIYMKKNVKFPNNNRHIIFPNCFGTAAQRWEISRYCSLCLTRDFARLCKPFSVEKMLGISKNFYDIVDSGVCARGLRLPGTRKCHKHKSCGGKGCSGCRGYGRIDDGRVYAFHFACRGATVLERMTKNLLNIESSEDRREREAGYEAERNRQFKLNATELQRGSITEQLIQDGVDRAVAIMRRKHEQARGVVTWKRVLKKASIRHVQDLTPNYRRPKDAEVFTGPKITSKGQGRHGRYKDVVSRMDPIFETVRRELSRFRPQLYGGLAIKQIRRSDKGTILYVHVEGRNQLRCLNLDPAINRGQHKNQGIWFEVNSKGMAQKCWCNCVTLVGRIGRQPCKGFTSERKPLLAESRRLLFPELKKVTTGRGPHISSGVVGYNQAIAGWGQLKKKSGYGTVRKKAPGCPSSAPKKRKPNGKGPSAPSAPSAPRAKPPSRPVFSYNPKAG